MISEALSALKPGAEWSVDNEDINKITWHDKTQSRPTDAEIEAELIRLKDEFDSLNYARARQKEYIKEGITIEAMIVALWEGDQSVINAMEDKRQAVKTRVPKV